MDKGEKLILVLGIAIAVGIVLTGVVVNEVMGSNKTAENNQDKKEFVEDVPESVNKSRPLAEDFYMDIREHFDDVRVFIKQDGEIVMEYSTTADSGEQVKTEIHQIANEYAKLVKEKNYTGRTLSIVVGQVQGVVPNATVRAYAQGEINQEAFLETIGVTTVERNDN